ncbi:hypothetical protein [Vampirovibrio chlorellavorus]|uniref:hypothetical protein n=1 Tax=Vampirovibrio chlorellavorus TaxID=758823 RepID=UPI0026EB846C|nr:hypothetical protein [Vampirovibrio chlorellavorus]
MTTDDLSNKVISIFQKYRRGEHFHFEVEEGGEMVISPDGFNYVSIKHDSNGLNEETSLLEVGDAKHYVIKMMEVHHDSHTVRLNNYFVPGNRLEEFMLSLAQRPGKLLEIKQFIPDTTA